MTTTAHDHPENSPPKLGRAELRSNHQRMYCCTADSSNLKAQKGTWPTHATN